MYLDYFISQRNRLSRLLQIVLFLLRLKRAIFSAPSNKFIFQLDSIYSCFFFFRGHIQLARPISVETVASKRASYDEYVCISQINRPNGLFIISISCQSIVVILSRISSWRRSL